jgi:hypothetical protein
MAARERHTVLRCSLVSFLSNLGVVLTIPFQDEWASSK